MSIEPSTLAFWFLISFMFITFVWIILPEADIWAWPPCIRGRILWSWTIAAVSFFIFHGSTLFASLYFFVFLPTILVVYFHLFPIVLACFPSSSNPSKISLVCSSSPSAISPTALEWLLPFQDHIHDWPSFFQPHTYTNQSTPANPS